MGTGAWGSAIKSLLEENSNEVLIWKDGEALEKNSTVIGAIPT
ncbi:MAG: hypothetical protein ACHQT7_02850, partial [Candidatus Levyibacteriota bacterium]